MDLGITSLLPPVTTGVSRGYVDNSHDDHVPTASRFMAFRKQWAAIVFFINVNILFSYYPAINPQIFLRRLL